MKDSTNKKGFTLVELILYVAIASSILLIATFFIQTLLESRVKNQTIGEVEQQGLQVVQRITQTVRNSKKITHPSLGDVDDSLLLETADSNNDPTHFYVSDGVIYSVEGSGSPTELTNSRVFVTDFSFHNVSYADTQGIVRISFTLTHVNNSQRQEYNYSKTFRTSVNIRQP